MSPLISCNLSWKPSCWAFFDATKQTLKNPYSWPLTASISLSASCSVWLSEAQTEFKRVAEENVTLPCHHHLGLLEQGSLDIEWLLHISETVQKAVGASVISTWWENCPVSMLTSSADIHLKRSVIFFAIYTEEVSST